MCYEYQQIFNILVGTVDWHYRPTGAENLAVPWAGVAKIKMPGPGPGLRSVYNSRYYLFIMILTHHTSNHLPKPEMVPL